MEVAFPTVNGRHMEAAGFVKTFKGTASKLTPFQIAPVGSLSSEGNVKYGTIFSVRWGPERFNGVFKLFAIFQVRLKKGS